MSTFKNKLFLSLLTCIVQACAPAFAETTLKGDSLSLRANTVPATCSAGKIVFSTSDSRFKICSSGVFVDIVDAVVPSQSGASGKALMSNGTNATWTSVTATPSAWFVSATIGGANPDMGTSDVTSFTEITHTTLTLTPLTGSAAAGVMCSSTNAATSPSTSPTTCAAGSESVGINFSAPTTNAYEICFYGSFSVTVDTAERANAAFQIINTPTNAQTLSYELGARQNVSCGGATIAGMTGLSCNISVAVCGIMNLTASTTYGFRLMYELDVTNTPNAVVMTMDEVSTVGQRNGLWTVKQLP